MRYDLKQLKIGSKQQEGNGTSRQLCFGDEHKLSACDLNTADLHAKLVEMGASSKSLKLEVCRIITFNTFASTCKLLFGVNDVVLKPAKPFSVHESHVTS